MPTTTGARAPRRLTSTPQSVEPATSTASGWSPSSRSASARSAARSKTPLRPSRRVAAAAGAGAAARATAVVVRSRAAERVRGVADRAVAGAAAQVAAEGVQVEAVGSVLVVDGPPGEGRAVAPVVLRRHPADEAGRAVAALRSAPHGQLVLHGVEVVGRSRGPRTVTISWPSRDAAGTRQALIAVQARCRAGIPCGTWGARP